jgi:outer membrane protein assembly complex protein YaeT
MLGTTFAFGQADAALRDPLKVFAGEKVHSIAFQGDGIADPQTLRELVPLKPGAVVDQQAVRDSLSALFLTNRFASLEVTATPTANHEVDITFVSRPNYFLGAIEVVGAPDPPTESQLANAGKLQLGNLYRPEDLKLALDRMQSTLQDDGYYKATIQYSLRYHPQIQQVDVIFSIQKGSRARVGSVAISGDPGLPAPQLLDIAKLHPGDHVDAARVSRALQRLRSYFQKRQRLEAQVSVTDRKYHADSNTLDYVMRVDRGPKVEIAVEGTKIRRSVIKKYVPVFEENAVDDDLLNEGRRNLRDYLQGQGYFDATVDFTHQIIPQQDKQVVVFDIDKGERHKVVAVNIEGNHYFDSATIRERMQVAPSSILLYHGRFSPAMLRHDVQAIHDLYQANGFEQVQVEPEVIDRGGEMTVVMHVKEGEQTRVEKLTVSGNEKFSDEQLRELITTTEGQPYSDYNVAVDRDALMNFYLDHGFTSARFDYSARKVRNDPPRMAVDYHITEGDQLFVNDVLISGLHFTRPYVVNQQVQLKDGDPLSQNDLLDTQRRLYDLGLFNEVKLAVQNPDGKVRDKNVLIQVEEAKRYTLTYGLGLEVQTGTFPNLCKNSTSSTSNTTTCQPQGRMGVSPRISFDVTRINFLGRDHTLILKTRVGRLQQRALFSYEAPRWFNRDNWKLLFTTFFDKTQDVRTFTAERLEGSAQLEQIINKGTTLLYRLTYRRVQVDPRTLQVSPDQIPLLSRPVRIGIPSFTYIRDTRDDPIEPTRGAYSTADLGIATGVFGSESNFARLLVQNATYHHPFPNKQWILARATRIGIEEPFGSGTSSFVPLPEKFFAGGANSQRGFAINQAGPRDLQTGFPIGGEALFLNLTELRTPPIVLPFVQDNLSVVIFHDMGNVFTDGHEMLKGLFRISQKNELACRNLSAPGQCDFNYVSHAVGLGLRYKTPIGPVRADFGFNLNPPFFPVRVPDTNQHSERLRRFVFHFSIGETF